MLGNGRWGAGGDGQPNVDSVASILDGSSLSGSDGFSVLSVTSMSLWSPGNRKPQEVQNFAPGRPGVPQFGQRSITPFRDPGFARLGAGVESSRRIVHRSDLFILATCIVHAGRDAPALRQSHRLKK